MSTIHVAPPPARTHDRPADEDDRDLPDDADLTVAQVCDLLGMSDHTLRYYEREGLVQVPRTASGRRAYGRHQIRRIEFLRRMRVSGMSMSRLAHYVDLVEQGEGTVPDRLALMQEHRASVLERMRELETALAATDYKIETYGGRLDGTCTPVPHPGENS